MEAHTNSTTYRQMSIAGIGLLAFLAIGTLACIALICACLWLISHLILITLQSVIEVASVIGSTYASSDPTVKVLLLIVLCYVTYRSYKGKRG